MTRRTVVLEPDHVTALPALGACTGWLRGPGDSAVDKAAWVAEVDAAWGPCGLVARVGPEAVGYVVYAPPARLPGLARLPTAPVSPDALVLAELWVDPVHRGGGLGRHLVRAAVRDLVDRYGADAPAVETFAAADDVTTALGEGEPCLRPRSFCDALGFTERRPHPVVPRMRLEPRGAVDWRGGVEQALARLRTRPRTAPVVPRGAARPGVGSRDARQPREADLPGL